MSAVFPLLFALLSVAGAVTAWRHNPMYTGRGTLRAVALMVLAIGAMIGMIVAAVDLTSNRSPVVVGAVMAVVVVFGALSLIFIIQAISTPKASKLQTAVPAGAAVEHVHRRKAYHWAKVFAVLVGTSAVLALLIPGNLRYLPLVIGGMSLLLAVILLPVMYVQARRFDLSLSALEAAPWVHWTYPPEEWAAWCRIQGERAQPQARAGRDWRKSWGALAAIFAAILLFTPGGWPERVLYGLFCCCLLLALELLGDRDVRRLPQRLQNRLLACAPEAYFGHDGLYCNGVYTTWLAVDVYLIAATVDPRLPPSLNFNFVKTMPGAYGGPTSSDVVQAVPLPAAGAAQDIARLQGELAARCPKARISLA